MFIRLRWFALKSDRCNFIQIFNQFLCKSINISYHLLSATYNTLQDIFIIFFTSEPIQIKKRMKN